MMSPIWLLRVRRGWARRTRVSAPHWYRRHL